MGDCEIGSKDLFESGVRAPSGSAGWGSLGLAARFAEIRPPRIFRPRHRCAIFPVSARVAVNASQWQRGLMDHPAHPVVERPGAEAEDTPPDLRLRRERRASSVLVLQTSDLPGSPASDDSFRRERCSIPNGSRA